MAFLLRKENTMNYSEEIREYVISRHIEIRKDIDSLSLMCKDSRFSSLYSIDRHIITNFINDTKRELMGLKLSGVQKKGDIFYEKLSDRFDEISSTLSMFVGLLQGEVKRNDFTHIATSPPTSPVQGTIYHDISCGKTMIYDGVKWNTL